MKTIGLLGGMSWQSTTTYYRAINEAVGHRLGGLHSAKIILNSVDFAEIETLQQQADWQRCGELLGEAATSVEKAGADFLLICTNTMHKVAPQIEAQLTIPLLHIADATGRYLSDHAISQVALLGTTFTMEETFYRERLESGYGQNVLIPGASDRKLIHDVIYEELCLGLCKENSKLEYLRIIEKLAGQGAEAVILGCTEIGLLVKQEDTPTILLDTTQIHVDAAVEYALNSD